MSNSGHIIRTRSVRRVIYRYIWDRLKVSFWFTPVVMSVAAISLSWVMLWVDDRIPNTTLENSRLVLSGSADQLRSALLGMATTVLATAGIVFTLLTLPLSTVVAQYGSRLLRVFLGDRITQYVLGMFVATFVYCIAAVTSIPSEKINPDGAQVTVTFGLLLMLGTFGSLILLIQHISTMLQAPNIAAAAGAELMEVIFAGASDETGNGDYRGQTGEDTYIIQNEKDCFTLHLNKTGYIAYVDLESLLTLAEAKDLVIHLLCKPGDFVQNGAAVAQIWPATGINDQLDRLIRRAFQIESQRTPTQDVVYAFKQLVEMAVRAMSPAINDPYTAITCLDYIGDGLILFIQQGQSSPAIYGRDGKCRIVFEPVTFDKLLDTSFNMLRHASCDNASVLQRMLKVIDAIGQETKSPELRRKLAYHVNLIRAERKAGSLIEDDQKLIDRECTTLQRKLKRVI